MRIVSILALVPVVGCIEGMPGESPAGTSVATAEVLGGQNSPEGKWPDTGALMLDGQQLCSAVLIAPTVALTAGHCNESSLSVLVGTNSLASATAGEMLSVARSVEYPNWQRSIDITVLVLEKPAVTTPRPLATGWARFDIKNGAEVALVGYGAIDRDAREFTNYLQEAVTTITDADCTEKPGCNASAQPAGELGAGGMGIDTCPGDSGGPAYLLTPYGSFVAGITSRGYDDAQYACTDGGIYGRPDKVVDWIEEQAGVPVAKGPTPTAARIDVVRGHAGETQIVPNDPKATSHVYAIKTPPGYATAKIREDGLVRVCADPGVQGGDSMVVSVTDANDPTRTLDVKVEIGILEGEPAESCDVNDFGGDEGGGCCDSGRSAGGALPLTFGVLAVLFRRRRRC